MIFRSPFPEIEIAEAALTPFVFERADELGAKPALVEGVSGRAISYAELAAQVRRVAAGFAARGLRKGDVVGVLCPNCPEFALAFYGATLAGGVVTPINPLYTPEEIAHQLRNSGARFMLTAPALLEKARAAAQLAGVEELFVTGAAAAGASAFASLLTTDTDAPHVEIEPRRDLAALPYSSGTTGVAKGVMLTHHNLVANLCQIAGTTHVSEADTLICVLPLFHIYGLQVILGAGLRAGATIVLLPRYELADVLRVIETYRVTFAHLVPPILLALARHEAVADYDLSSLKTIFSGAAPLSEEIARTVAERFDCRIRQGYGMTETAPVIHMVPHEPAAAGGRYHSVGWCAPATECKIVDEAGQRVGVGVRGEICARGPQVMRGYLNNPTATAATIDADGWLHTGDIGYADADGYFFIVDRVKELIKYKGFQVAPAELEALLLTHPAVADAAVVPSPDPEAGEVPKAFVVLRDAARAEPATMEELLTYVAARVAPHKKVRRLEFVTQIPKSASGKILRRVLTARERAEGTS
ncbi:MAG TPA: 4-coumarate--CoA ligase family protein [Pyrinomonadaceae bacterium]|jgi:acyl-CoA synthetase (AMP-forming)/AMP-acid ligase II